MDNKEKNFISAVIYVHNCENRIGEFLKTVIRVLENNFEDTEIICVNDFSSDRSIESIKKAAREAAYPDITVVNMSYFHGLEPAMSAGMDTAIGDFVFEFDRPIHDFDESLIVDVYRRSLEGFDIVSASPDKKGRLSSRIFYSVFDRFSNLSYKMTTERFRILSRRVINRISSSNNTVPYRKAVYAGSGLKTDNIVYTPTGREKPENDRMERRYRSTLAADSLILFTQLGYRISILMTAIMMLISVFVLAYTLITYFTQHPVAGWTTTILFLSISFLGLFGILTVIIKYLQLLVDMVFRRKHYSFESVEKLTNSEREEK